MKELTIPQVEELKKRLNERLKGLNIEIEVQASFIIMVGLLVEELLKESTK